MVWALLRAEKTRQQRNDMSSSPPPPAPPPFSFGTPSSDHPLLRSSVDWRSRPARKQQEHIESAGFAPSEYDEHGRTWNPYWGFYEGKQVELGPRKPRATRVSLERDSGWTAGDRKRDNYYCVLFAKGECVRGHECPYYHHLPTPEDELRLPPTVDIFGREKFGYDGSDSKNLSLMTLENRTLYVQDFPAAENKEELARILDEHFCEFGNVVYINAFPDRNYGFVRFKFRVQAEFAKEAMDRQPIGGAEGSSLTVKWAREDPNPAAVAERKRIREEIAQALVAERMQEWALSASDSGMAEYYSRYAAGNAEDASTPHRKRRKDEMNSNGSVSDMQHDADGDIPLYVVDTYEAPDGHQYEVYDMKSFLTSINTWGNVSSSYTPASLQNIPSSATSSSSSSSLVDNSGLQLLSGYGGGDDEEEEEEEEVD